MSDKIELDIEGIETVLDRLKNLNDKTKGELVGQALEAGAEPIKRTAVSLCPFKTGATQEAIQTHKGHKRDGYQSVVVGPSKEWYQGDRFYAAFVELGHYQGKRASASKKHRGEAMGRVWIEPKPFMRPAYEQNKEQAVEIITDKIIRGLNAE